MMLNNFDRVASPEYIYRFPLKFLTQCLSSIVPNDHNVHIDILFDSHSVLYEINDNIFSSYERS